MGGYEREEELEDEYYDDYVDEEEHEEGGEGYEYEEEEEEEDQRNEPTREELEYLGLRERLKESIRKQMKREHGSSSSSPNKRQKLPFDNYGSFFGPSKPVIAQRVIQESKSLLENHHLASRISNVHDNNTKTITSSSTASGSKPRAHDQIPRVTNELKTKVQKLKDTRDYSFLLSDDAATSPHVQDSWRQNVSSNSDARSGGSSQMQMNRKPPLGNSSRHTNGVREERRPVSSNGHMHSKVVPKVTSASRLSSTSVDPTRKLGSRSGNGPGRPVGSKGFPLKKPVATMEKMPAPGTRNSVSGLHKPSSSKLPSSAPKQYSEHTRGKQEPNKGKIVPRQPVASSRPQETFQKTSKPLRPNPPPRTAMQNTRLKKPVRRHSDDSDDPESALAMIRNMFKYDPNKYAGVDEDDSDMEANFDDILREEKRSARIARKEDEEEERKLLEEERLLRLAKKKRKMGQQ